MGSPAGRSLCLLGRGGSCERASGDVVYWDELVVPVGSVSIPQLVEDQAETLRDEYVSWCVELGEVRFDGQSLKSRLASRLLGGGSFWWTTLIAQHSPMVTPAIKDVFRLRSLELYYRRGVFTGLEYRGSDKRLAFVLKDWMRSLGHPFSWHSPPVLFSSGGVRRWFDCLPYALQSLLYAGHFLVKRYYYARSGPRPSIQRDADLVVFTYFPNIDVEKARAGEFSSSYWGPLPGLFRQLGLRVTWVWFYANSSQLTYQESVALRRQLNSRHFLNHHESFLMLEDFMTLRDVLSAFASYLLLWFRSLKLRPVRQYFRLLDSDINFFSLLKSDWLTSLCGSEAMKHCLYAAAMRATLKRTGPGREGLLYAWENQGWEQILLYLAQNLPMRRTLAFAHTNSCTAPLFMRTVLGKEVMTTAGARPLPDCLVATGEASRDVLVSWGWPAERIHVAEAVRYMELVGKHNMLRRTLPGSNRRLLMVSGYMLSEAIFQVKILQEAADCGALSSYSSITIKPHPFCPVDDLLREMSLPVPVNVAGHRLDVLFQDADVVYAANSTSAAVEAAWFGLPLILTAALDGLNLSPLKGLKGVTFIANAGQLAQSLDTPAQVELWPEYYNLDPELRGWKSLLECKSD